MNPSNAYQKANELETVTADSHGAEDYLALCREIMDRVVK